MTNEFKPIDWEQIKLVIFDVDGTLYNQKKLRIFMLNEMLIHACLQQDLTTLNIIRKYRIFREQLGNDEVFDFEKHLIQKTSDATGKSKDWVCATINLWIENKPLKHLFRCKYDGLDKLFNSIKRNGKLIGILSDYKVNEKLKALDLKADFLAYAGDASINVLKPHPKGLFYLMEKAQVNASQTLLIGDRHDRDGLAAARAGIKCLIKSSKHNKNDQIFTKYDDAIFSPILDHV